MPSPTMASPSGSAIPKGMAAARIAPVRSGGGPCILRSTGHPEVHLAVDESTLEVRAVKSEQANATGSKEPANGSGAGNAPVSPDLPAQIPEDEPIAAVANQGADAVIPPRCNDAPWNKHSSGAAGGNEALRAVERSGCAIWRRWSGHHRRSRAEAKMTCMTLLGRKLMSVRHRLRTDGGSMACLRPPDRRTPGPHRLPPIVTPHAASPSRDPSPDPHKGKGEARTADVAGNRAPSSGNGKARRARPRPRPRPRPRCERCLRRDTLRPRRTASRPRSRASGAARRQSDRSAHHGAAASPTKSASPNQNGGISR